jgi:Holliday junction resolvase RusA-like endonuclease
MIKLEFKIKPMAMQSFRIGRNNIKYQPSKSVKWKNFISLEAKNQVPKGFSLMDGYIAIEKSLFVFPAPKSIKKRERVALKEGKFILKNTKPDMTDNLFKGLIDALAGIVFTNDSRICINNGNSGKVYGLDEDVGIYLNFKELTDNIVDKKYFEYNKDILTNSDYSLL